MAESMHGQSQPQAAHAERIDPIRPLDAAAATSTTSPDAPAAGAGANALQNVLPEIQELARKVGGYRKLAEIVGTLEQTGK